MQKKEKDLLFEQIILKYQNLIFKICMDMIKNKEESANLLQDTFLSFYKYIDRYIELSDNEIKNIICKIALNKARDYLKKYEYNMQIDSIEDIDVEIKEDENITNKIIQNEKKEKLLNKINTLKSPYKEVLIEYYLKEKSLDDVAKKLKVPKATLKMQIYRAKKVLKEKLKGEELYE